MILLLDAHALLWWLGDDATLRREAREAIASPLNDVFISAAIVWELAIKRRLGKLAAPTDLASALKRDSMTGLPIAIADAEAAGALPPHHRDPFDRMLVAQAQRLGALIVTRDQAFAAYGVEVLPA